MILGILVPGFKFKRSFQYFSNPDLSLYSIWLLNISKRIILHLSKSSLAFLLTPLELLSLPPPLAITVKGGAV